MDSIYPELKKIENELKEIKLMLKTQKKNPIKLDGTLKNVKITKKDVDSAKKSLMKRD